MQTADIKVALTDSQSTKTVASVTIVGEDGRMARCWVSVAIVNGRAVATISGLGKQPHADKSKKISLPWHANLNCEGINVDLTK